MSLHSPGPCSPDPEGEAACTIEDANGKPICDVYIERDAEGVITEESQANVNLIEAVPILLAALRNLLGEVRHVKGICTHCGRDNRDHEDEPCSDDCPGEAARKVLARVGGQRRNYPMELFINGELSFKLATEDAEGDLAAIKALMTIRTAKRQNRPLTDMELYGTDLGPDDVIHRAPCGKLRVDSPPTEGQN